MAFAKAILVCVALLASTPFAPAQSYTFTTIAGRAGTPGSADGSNDSARFNFPSEITVDRNGILYVSDMLNHTIRKVTPVGTNWVVSTIAGQAGVIGDSDGTNSNALFDRPNGIKVDDDGNLIMADLYNHMIRKIAPIGTDWVTTPIAGLTAVHGGADGTNSEARFYSPRGIALGRDGTVYVADSANFTIRGITHIDTNWVVKTIAGEALFFGFTDGTNEWAEFNTPFGLAADPGSTVFVADWGNHAIRQVEHLGPDWVTTTIAGFSGLIGSTDGPGTQAMFNFPASVTIDKARNLYVTDQSNHTIRKLTPNGKDWDVATLAGAALQRGSQDGAGGNARFNKPWGIAIDSVGTLFVADYANHTIRKGVPSLSQLPVLHIEIRGNQAVVSWPAAATNFGLETADTPVALLAAWQPLTNGIIVTGNTCFLTNEVTSAPAFFRLRQQ